MAGRLIPAALALLWTVAAVIRLYDLGGRPLWVDEAWVALAALQPHLKDALAGSQPTPPLYILTVWALVQLGGASEAVLRSLSFLFGLGTVVLFWPLARRLAPVPAALAGLAAVALSPRLVYFSKELKQYSGDAFFAVLLLWLGERLRSREGERGWIALAVAGLFGLGYSHTLIFLLPVLAAVLGVSLPSRQRRTLMLVGGIWGLGFLVYYGIFIRRQIEPDLLAYWAQDFPDFSGLIPFAQWLGAALSRYLTYFLGEWGLIVGGPLVLAGGALLLRQKSGRGLVYLGGPLLAALLAAALHRYPFMGHYGGSRLMLFSAPLLYLVAASALAGGLTWLWQRRQHALALAAAGIILWGLHPYRNIQDNLHPSDNREELRPLIRLLNEQIQPGDYVYVHYFAVPAFSYYCPRPPEHLICGKSCLESPLDLPSSGTSPPRRLWLVATHFEELAELRKFAAHLAGPDWREAECLTRPGAALFLLERQRPAR